MQTRFYFRLILLFGIFLQQSAYSQNWTQWRGPGRDGHVKEFTTPETWPDSLRTIWSVDGGAGLSSPLVADGRIYLLTREGEDEVVSSYSVKDGSRLWQQRYATPFIPNAQATVPFFFPESKGKGPFATPVLHNGKLYTLGIDRMLSCFDAKSGALHWQHHYLKQKRPEKLVYECPPCGCSEDGKEFPEQGNCSACRMGYGIKGMETSATLGQGNYYGAAASPVVTGGIGIVNIGSPKGGDLIAFDLETDDEKWRWKGPAPSSSSPIVKKLHGIAQVIVLTRTNLAGVAVADGRELWQYEIESNAQIVTPILFEDTIIFSAYRSPTTAVKITKTDGAWSAEKAWETNEITLYTSTPVLVGDKLYGLSYTKRGQFFAMDARTGKTIWTSEGRMAAGAAILNVGETVFALTNDARLIAMAREAGTYKPIANYKMAASPTWATPVLWGRHILVKDESKLSLWQVE